MTGKVAAVVVAAGRGQRAGGDVPKQYRNIAGEPVIRPTLGGLSRAPADRRGAAGHPCADDGGLSRRDRRPAKPVAGLRAAPRGKPRCAPGLRRSARHAPDFVLIHDAARPFLTGALIARAIDAAAEHRAAVPGVAVADTVKKVDELETVSPRRLIAAGCASVQTPQAFAFDLIIEAHRRAAAAGREDFTDDAALAEWAGHRVSVFAGETTNVKLTTNDDFIRAEVLRMCSSCRHTHRQWL